jgi:hypothetical protein
VSLITVVKKGDRRKSREAMALGLAQAFEVADPAVKAQISGQLLKVLEQLDALAPPEKGSKTDELRRRLGKSEADVTPLRRRRA